MAANKLPSKVRIGHAWYTVVSNAATDADLIENGLAGASNGNILKIAVRSDLPWLSRIETLLHEILHQCLFVAGLSLDDKVEEKVIRPLSMVLLGVLRDNPKFVQLLLSPQE